MMQAGHRMCDFLTHWPCLTVRQHLTEQTRTDTKLKRWVAFQNKGLEGHGKGRLVSQGMCDFSIPTGRTWFRLTLFRADQNGS